MSNVDKQAQLKLDIQRWPKAAAVDQRSPGHLSIHVSTSASLPDARWVEGAAGDHRGHSWSSVVPPARNLASSRL